MLRKMASFLSGTWELTLLPWHALTLTRLRLLARRLEYQLDLELGQDYAALCSVITTAQRMEAKAATADLRLNSSRRAVAAALQTGLANLKHRATTRLQEPPESGSR